jgi:beta-galactosidase
VWDGERYVPVEGASTAWAAASGEPTVITFDAVRGSRIRLTLTSAYPGETRGAVRIARLELPGT